jgi:large subunit ribosomal protein L20
LARIKPGKTTRRRHKAVLKAASGYHASRSRRYKVAKEAVLHAMDYATAHRRLKKRQNRSLAILRINAASTANGMSYSRLMHGLRQAGIGLDRKSLSELAVREPAAFAEVVGSAKAAAGA